MRGFDRDGVIGGVRLLGSMMGAALIAGCTIVHTPGNEPTVLVHSPLGPPRVISGGTANAPPMPPAGARVSIAELSGVYSGGGTNLPKAGCPQTKRVRDFRVSDGRVRWNGLRGTIASDGGLEMSSSGTWVYGQFVGSVFRGTITQWSPHNFGCTYNVELRRA